MIMEKLVQYMCSNLPFESACRPFGSALAASHTTPSSEMVRQLPQGRLIHAIMLTIATMMIFQSRR
jgi:hypothetical protein